MNGGDGGGGPGGAGPTARLTPPPLGLYVHLPWCVRKCPYCDFNSHVWREVDHPAWREGLLAEIDEVMARIDEAMTVLRARVTAGDPPTAVQMTTSMELAGANSPGLMMPTCGT